MGIRCLPFTHAPSLPNPSPSLCRLPPFLPCIPFQQQPPVSKRHGEALKMWGKGELLEWKPFTGCIETRSRTMWTTMRKLWCGDLASWASSLIKCWQLSSSGSSCESEMAAKPLINCQLASAMTHYYWFSQPGTGDGGFGWMGPNNGWHLFRPPPPLKYHPTIWHLPARWIHLTGSQKPFYNFVLCKL